MSMKITTKGSILYTKLYNILIFVIYLLHQQFDNSYFNLFQSA